MIFLIVLEISLIELHYNYLWMLIKSLNEKNIDQRVNLQAQSTGCFSISEELRKWDIQECIWRIYKKCYAMYNQLFP